jgi:hypothetical protein
MIAAHTEKLLMSYSGQNMSHFIENHKLCFTHKKHRENAKHTKQKNHAIQKKSQKS